MPSNLAYVSPAGKSLLSPEDALTVATSGGSRQPHRL